MSKKGINASREEANDKQRIALYEKELENFRTEYLKLFRENNLLKMENNKLRQGIMDSDLELAPDTISELCVTPRRLEYTLPSKEMKLITDQGEFLVVHNSFAERFFWDFNYPSGTMCIVKMNENKQIFSASMN